MRRRRVLQTVGAVVALSGCLTSTPQSTPSMNPPDKTPTGYWRWVTITDHEQPPDRYQVEITSEVTRPWITSEDTAHIQVELTNLADEPRQLGPVVDGPDFPAEGIKGILLRDETDTKRSHPPECIDDESNKQEDNGPTGYSGAKRLPHEVGAGETISRTVMVFDDENVDGCVPPGIYPFQLTHLVVGPEDKREGAPQYTWTFALGIRGNE